MRLAWPGELIFCEGDILTHALSFASAELQAAPCVLLAAA